MTLQERRKAELREQHARLAERRDAAIARLCRIAGQLAKVQKQLARYDKRKAGQKGNDISLTGIEPPEAEPLNNPLPPNGDPLDDLLI